MEAVFREFRKQDLDAFFFLDKRCYAEAFQMQYNQLISTLLDKDTVAMVIELENADKPLGGGLILRAEHWTKRMNLISLMVDEPLRRLKLGSRLMKWAEHLAASHQLPELAVAMESENEGGQHFLEACGFEKTEIFQPFFSTPEAGRLWGKKLPDKEGA